jgi:FlaA1/EpsC-like NDP-sugar epimerase
MNKKRLASLYFFVDWIASILAWTLFYFFRKAHEDLYINYWDRITHSFVTPSFWLGVIIIPICWLILHAVTGAYEKVYFKSRLKELGQTFFITLLGVVVLFFVVILDDEVPNYKSYYQSFIALFTLQFLMTYIPRLIITTSVISRIRSKKIGFNTLIVGSNDNACAIFKEIEDEVKPSGRRLIGFLNVYDKKEYKLGEFLPRLGSYHEIERIVKEQDVEEVIIAIERSDECAAYCGRHNGCHRENHPRHAGFGVRHRQAVGHLAGTSGAGHARTDAHLAEGGEACFRHRGLGVGSSHLVAGVSALCHHREGHFQRSCILCSGTHRQGRQTL